MNRKILKFGHVVSEIRSRELSTPRYTRQNTCRPYTYLLIVVIFNQVITGMSPVITAVVVSRRISVTVAQLPCHVGSVVTPGTKKFTAVQSP